MPRLRTLAPVLSLLALGACGDNAEKDSTQVPRDPAISGALLDPILTDPDLTGQGEAGSAISGMGSFNVDLPPDDRGPDAAAAARKEAVVQSGGTIQPAPPPEEGKPLAAPPLTVADAARILDPRCAGRVEFTAAWAARLPSTPNVYPRGAVQDAAGTDQGGCRLRAVNFRTPVTAGDVIDFYYTQARKAGFRLQHLSEGKDRVLTGKRAGAGFLIRARVFDRDVVSVDLVTSGI